jgi:protein-S-isoprenylcysteine O-methyltransferase Ste14
MSAPAATLGVPARRRIWATRAFCAGVVLLFLVSRPGWHEAGFLAPHLLTPLGLLLAAGGALGRLWCSSYIAGRKDMELITSGPYSVMRNPLYFFSFLGGLGIAITTETLTVPLLFVAWFAYYYRDVIAGEEHRLLALFQDQYRDYRARVPRFWPRLTSYAEPARWELSPPGFRRSLAEVVWFVIAAVSLHGLHDLREALAMAALFPLY